MIFLDTNVISETLRRSPSPEVMTWLAIHDDSLAIPAVTIAELAYGIAKIQPDERSTLLQQGLTPGVFGLPDASSRLRSARPSSTARSWAMRIGPGRASRLRTG